LPDCHETLELITKLAEQESEPAIEILASTYNDNDAWKRIARLAKQGSPATIKWLAQQRSNDQKACKLIGHLAGQGSTEAITQNARYQRIESQPRGQTNKALDFNSSHHH
jgi:hypothetical protein